MMNYFENFAASPATAVDAEAPATLVLTQAQVVRASADPSQVYTRWSGALNSMFTVQNGRVVYGSRFSAAIDDNQRRLMENARRDFDVTPENRTLVEAAARVTAEQLVMNQIATNIAGIRSEIAYDRSNITTNPNLTGTQAVAELQRYDRVVTVPIHRMIDSITPAFNARGEALDAAVSLEDLRGSGVLRRRQSERSESGSASQSNYEYSTVDRGQLFELNARIVTAHAVRDEVLLAA